MNYHDDFSIIGRLGEHYEEARGHFGDDRIVALVLQGSQNYGLDMENSDVDSKLVLVPTFKDIAMARKPISTTHVMENDEHIDFKDVRLFVQLFKKMNLNFLEVLFTKYYILNPTYAYQWRRLLTYKEEIAHYNPVAAVTTAWGMAKEKHRNLTHEFPSRIDWINKFGYDPKQLTHLLRFEEYTERYMAGESVGDAMITKQADYLKDVKMGLYSLDEAKDVADKALAHMNQMVDEMIANKNQYPVNKEIGELLDDVQYEIMKIAVTKEMEW